MTEATFSNVRERARGNHGRHNDRLKANARKRKDGDKWSPVIYDCLLAGQGRYSTYPQVE